MDLTGPLLTRESYEINLNLRNILNFELILRIHPSGQSKWKKVGKFVEKSGHKIMHFGAKISEMATGISTFGLNVSRVGSAISLIGSQTSVNTVGLDQR